MKSVVYIFSLLLVLAGCTGTSRQPQLVAVDSILKSRPDSSLKQLKRMDVPQSRADRTYYYLLLADAANKCYDTLPSDSIMREVADFYDSHGTPNERLRAHYLLGCVYRDMGEAPMALQYFQQAIERADTTAHDCNFAQLSRVYGQMGALFYGQSLYRKFLVVCQHAARFAMVGGDTLSALIYYEQQSIAYRELGKIDSAINVVEDVARLYSQYGFHTESAIALGSIANTLVKIGDYKKAHEYMHKYETESGLFNGEGDIEMGREFYYNPKGLYYLKNNQLDSAEYWYRKELSDGKDFNNQNGGALGLAMVYEQRHIPDSAAKYYHYAYAMNDSMYAQMTTNDVERIQAMYDYSRNQSIARQKTAEANQTRQMTIILMFVLGFVLIISIVGFLLWKRRKQEQMHEQQLRYEHDIEMMEQALDDLNKIKQIKDEQAASLIREKTNLIEQLQQQLDEQESLNQKFLKTVEEKIITSDIYRHLQYLLQHPREAMTPSDWESLEQMVEELLPTFKPTIYQYCPNLSLNDYRLCILVRLYFSPSEISVLTGMNKANISVKRYRLLHRLFKQKDGSAKDFDKKIQNIK